jgi:hypothetical protein
MERQRIDTLADKETGIVAQPIEHWFHLTQFCLRLCLDQETNYTGHAQSKLFRNATPFAFIEQQQIGVQFKGKCDCFCLALIKIAPQSRNECAIRNGHALYPRRPACLVTSRPLDTVGVEFAPHWFGDEDVLIEFLQQVELLDCG